MNNEELPDYKVTFLREMDQLREQQMREQANEDPSILAQPTVPAYLPTYSELPLSRTTSSTRGSTVEPTGRPSSTSRPTPTTMQGTTTP